MTGIIIAGHGHFATGIFSAVELVLGKQENCLAVDFPEGDTKTELEAHIHQAVEAMAGMEHILVFCDIISGSPFNTIMMEALKDSRMKVFYGTNLGMLIDTVMSRNMGVSWEELTAGLVEKGKEQVGTYRNPEKEPEGTAADEADDWD